MKKILAMLCLAAIAAVASAQTVYTQIMKFRIFAIGKHVQSDRVYINGFQGFEGDNELYIAIGTVKTPEGYTFLVIEEMGKSNDGDYMFLYSVESKADVYNLKNQTYEIKTVDKGITGTMRFTEISKGIIKIDTNISVNRKQDIFFTFLGTKTVCSPTPITL